MLGFWRPVVPSVRRVLHYGDGRGMNNDQQWVALKTRGGGGEEKEREKNLLHVAATGWGEREIK